MDQPIRSRKKELPPDHPTHVPGTPPYPPIPDPDIDVDVIDIKVPGGDAPAPDVDPPRERAGAAADPTVIATDRESRKQQT
jgi:hypothetical protein